MPYVFLCLQTCTNTHVCMYTAMFNCTCVLGHICRQACVSIWCFCRFKCVFPQCSYSPSRSHLGTERVRVQETGDDSLQVGFSAPSERLLPEFPSDPAPGLLKVTRDFLSILWQPSMGRWGWRAEPSVAQSHHTPFLIHLCPV